MTASVRAKDIAFGARRLGAGHPVVVFAEIGVNHEGDPGKCAELILAAKGAGADAVKLQSADPDEHYVPGTESHRIFSTARLSFSDTTLVAMATGAALLLGVKVVVCRAACRWCRRRWRRVGVKEKGD